MRRDERQAGRPQELADHRCNESLAESKPCRASSPPTPGAGGPSLPSQSRRYREVPYRADGRPQQTGEPPRNAPLIEERRHHDVDEGADAADETKADQAPGQVKAPQPAITIGEQVVEIEVEGHGQQRGRGLTHNERGRQQPKQEAQYAQMQDRAERPDHDEHDKPDGDEASDQLLCQQHEKLPHHLEIELAFATRPRLHLIG